jgi:hypothetical protein
VSPEPIVVCPLEFERRVLRRAGLDDRCRLACCGPGPEAVVQWAAGITTSPPVILCGLAGSVSGAYPAGSAHVPAAVVADDGRRLTPTLGAGHDPAPLLGSADRTLTTPEAKRAWARRTGADLVDREAAAFAGTATDRGWQWTVVRGVGDGPQTPLPGSIDTWVDDRGRTRAGAVFRAVALGRAGIRPLIRLRSDSVAALRAAAGIIRRMLDDLDGSSR